LKRVSLLAVTAPTKKLEVELGIGAVHGAGDHVIELQVGAGATIDTRTAVALEDALFNLA